MNKYVRRSDRGLGKTATGGTGGSFATHTRNQAGAPPPSYANLDEANEHRRAIIDRLSRSGAVRASTVESATDPRFTDGIDMWWGQHFERMEQPPEGNVYRVMPDDYTPARTDGLAISGKRRTHRMRYSGAGVEMRMPSATAIRRFSRENHRQTFDLPIEMEHAGGRISGYVRVTEGAGGAWDVQAMGFPDHASKNRAAEAVTCVLEARRPTTALKNAEAQYSALRDRTIESRVNGEDQVVVTGHSALQQRQIDRAARTGAQMRAPQVRSFITAGGYDRATNTMVVTMNGNRSYAYKVPRSVYESVMTSNSPGRAYNQLVKGQAERVSFDRCGKCRRTHRSEVAHACPTQPKASRRKSDPHRRTVATLLLNLAQTRRTA